MLDIKRILAQPDVFRKAMHDRNCKVDIEQLFVLDGQRREIIAQVEALKSKRNAESAQIAKLKREKQDASELIAQMGVLGDEIKQLDERLSQIEEQLQGLLMTIPNMAHESVPVGKDDTENVCIRKWGEPSVFPYEPKAHWDIGSDLDILDANTAAKVTGSRFTFYKGVGARLERSCINYMMDTHASRGYTEVLPPYMVNRASMTGTGQLPKFEEDAFKVTGTDYFMIPTAEVPVTNMYRETILDGDMLPMSYCAYSACFRAEAGSAGRDTRGLIRQHQFNKVELVKFVKPEDGYAELEKLTQDAEYILQTLGLPYRVMALSTGDLGFSSAKTYDLEVWMPSYGRYVEISSCSCFEDFQARRAGIKFRNAAKEKPQFVYTLNGSGLAVGRTVAAILENYQNPDGSVTVPEALVSYMGCTKIGEKL